MKVRAFPLVLYFIHPPRRTTRWILPSLLLYNEGGEEGHQLIKEGIHDTTSSACIVNAQAFQIQALVWVREPYECRRYKRRKRRTSRLGTFIPPHLAWYSSLHNQNMPSHSCNWDTKDSTIPSGIVSMGSQDVTDACGLYISGKFTSRLEWPKFEYELLLRP